MVKSILLGSQNNFSQPEKANLDLIESELFRNLLEKKDELFHVDLHNDYTCVNATLSADILELKFQNDKGQGYITLQVKDVVILKM
jgi:hypothetical protein